ncbi:aminotransferase class I/II-fold pyridoxal phosphate-dependent enzyme [Alphaproteobacteria bacterium]|jgi:N-succinyldiaminopimelate aminotransferase|nr:aminotransferase class I/II-fold pyridoxal phosphate-dependent enzyme [Alphaproteobacteria bacterium]MDA9190498.1 aminotransferase class I/II-fold pyridoxal phosphate-dependent enzyme [Alphaproteobacteria bacterium]MDA9815879.1 aminotransferase class I/II-fold pyridoxal phosphate-dependent enzyme [Alphaproteobacteria bacterium]MDC0462506.1 aminotransferase class I/II-fold pyridoxal phosphate-dependent enzyme [Alphaproteobacteria bacterium]
MQNPDFSLFNDNMFEKTRALITGISAPDDLSEINMSIGEPQLPPPAFVSELLSLPNCNWHSYPKVKGNKKFYDDVSYYLNNRFSDIGNWLQPLEDYLLPVPGTREPLHMLGYCTRSTKPNPLALVTNPFYHAWRAAGLINGGEVQLMNASLDNGFLPDLSLIDEVTLARTTIMYLCTPTNPQGIIASEEYLADAIILARKHNFLLVVDECYIDIWRHNMPVSSLEVARKISGSSEHKLSNLAVLNSLSKRSNAAGLRAGFLCADPKVISSYSKIAANGLALVPTPLLNVAGEIYRDFEHNKLVRSHYNNAFKLAEKYLDCDIPEGGFFLWLKVGDDLRCAQLLWEKMAIKVIPGSYMALASNAENPASGYIRIAMVHSLDTIEQAMQRLQIFFNNIWRENKIDD